ncbi:mucin-20 [Equus caballus]|uniref:Mucin 20, cell surface associated n=1 Tax=Equus caballus TaxID=9796 RepID=A0A9L0RMJ6_HORSE|nr:mucin-20 [Equus caballus]
MVAGSPARMGSLWGLLLPLFFFCWEAGAPRSSAGPSTSGPGPLVTTSHTEVPAVTPGVRTSSEGAFQTTDLAETSVPSHIPLESHQTLRTQTSHSTLIPGSTIPEAETTETRTISLAAETRALTKRTPSKFMVVMTPPMETTATSDNPTRTGMTTVQIVTGSDLLEAAFDTLCTDDSSEEAKRIRTSALTLAQILTEAKALTLESSTSSDSSVPAITTSQVLAPHVTAPAKALVASTISDIEVTNGSVMETETTASIPKTSDTAYSPAGGKALSTPEVSALPNPTEAKSHLTETTTSAEASSTASTAESATHDTTVETPLPATSTTERETTAAEATTPSGTWATVSVNPVEEVSALSAETTSHTEVPGAFTVSTEAGSTVGKGTSLATVYSLSEGITIKSSTRSETSTTDSRTNGPIPDCTRPLPSVHPTTADSSQEENTTLAKTTASAKTLKTASTTRGQPPKAVPTTAQTRGTTEVPASGDGGFLLLRLSVASPEDLTEPRVAERLMQQLLHELHIHMPRSQVSLLRIRRG